MLNEIKCSFFFSFLLSHVDEGRKLKIIRYNKKMQNLLGIDIIYYKIFSGKYFLYESNGKGTIYNNFQQILYEGEYSNGERNGKGREYKSDLIKNLIFEGEFLFGKRNGIGKEYNKNTIIYEGEYSKGERHGKGKEYDNNGKLIFEGEYFNGKK